MPPIHATVEFESLVRAHHAEVYRSALRIVVNEADALDVTQQVFLRALEGKLMLADGQDRGRALRWLAARTALAHLRSARTRREKEEQHAMETRDERPENEATGREAELELRRLVSRLPEELRTALVLRFEEGWTFSQIAREENCSEPSAHDRVRRGLERLRGELSRAGFAGFGAALPQGWSLHAPELAASPPAGLEARLLALKGSAAVSATAKIAAAILALISVVAVASAAAWWPANTQAGDEVAELIQPSLPVSATLPQAPAAGERTPVPLGNGARGAGANAAGSRAAEQPIQNGTLIGRFVDASGVPVAEVSVFATSRQFSGKFARFAASAVTGQDGRFELALPVSIAEGEEYALSTRHLDFVMHESSGHGIRAKQITDIGTLPLLASSSDAPGDSVLDVLVLDGSGAALPHCAVNVWRTVLGADAATREECESSARTDIFGRTRISMTRLGAKRLHVLPPEGELGPASLALGIDAPGRFERTVVLERGLTISGTVFCIGEAVVHGQGGFLAAVGDPQLPWIHATTDDASGTFVLSGLEDREYTLVRDGDGFSRVEIPGVRAGTAGLALQLKREDDTRDIGDHQGELHGIVRDALSGEVLTIGAFAISVVDVGDMRGQDWERDVLPGLIYPRPVQTAMFGEYVPPLAFHVDGLRAGTYFVSARTPGCAPAFAGPFELGAREIRSGIVIEVHPPAAVRGVLTDSKGRPLSGGFVRVTGVGERSMERDRACDAELRATRGKGAISVWDDMPVDSAGRFEVKGLPAWSGLRLAIHHPDFEMAYSGTLELHSGATTDIGPVRAGARYRTR